MIITATDNVFIELGRPRGRGGEDEAKTNLIY